MQESRPTAIFLTTDDPFPPQSGPSLRDAHLIRLLAERTELEVICFSSGVTHSSAPAGVTFTRLKPKTRPNGILHRVLTVLQPKQVSNYSAEVAKTLRARAAPGKILWVSRFQMAVYIPLAKSLGYRVILDEHLVESHAILASANSPIGKWPVTLAAARCAFYEERYCGASDIVVTSSEIDAARVTKLAPQALVQVIPNSVDCLGYSAGRTSDGKTLMFSGTLSHPNNIEGLRWFMSEVLPRLKAALKHELPKIVVAGANPSAQLKKELSENGIELHENPPSIVPLLAQAAVVFVPIRSGNGTRLKILEAMAAGRAVVSTGKGAEGLDLTPSHDLLVADKADAFTSSIIRLLRDPELRAALGKRAVNTIESRYDWQHTRPLIQELFSLIERSRKNKGRRRA